MANMGFAPVLLIHDGVLDDGYYAYLHPVTGVVAHDLRDENVVRFPESQDIAVLTPKPTIYREFNYLSLTSESNINRLTTVASGAAYPAVNPEVVAAQTIALPDAELILQFHQATTSFFDLIERHRAQNQELTTLRECCGGVPR